MMSDEATITTSPLCQRLEQDGHWVDIEIYTGEGDDGWILEVVDELNSSTVWDDTFATDQAAYDYVVGFIKQEGISYFIEQAPKARSSIHH